MKPTSIIVPLLFLWMANANAVEPQISAGKYQNMAIDSDGAVYMWSASANSAAFRGQVTMASRGWPNESG